ncbi:MAG: GNAT family N-acyltransferase [Roseovarius sp.]|nr:GNAT family N-acyltransferase [Roseovarius sp.]
MQGLQSTRYQVRVAQAARDIDAAQRLRHLAFAPVAGGNLDCDAFDPLCTHFLIEEQTGGRLVGCFRMLPLASGAEINRSYAAQFYDLKSLSDFAGPMSELGRFCIHPAARDPDILRHAWAAMTRHVDRTGVKMLFGCSSFHGTDPAPYRDSFALLRDRHPAPEKWRPGVGVPGVFRFSEGLEGHTPDPKLALRAMPPLLRSYLLMGGWVSDHAVIDTAMNTLHVFTGVEIGAIPPMRKRLLRAMAGS